MKIGRSEPKVTFHPRKKDPTQAAKATTCRAEPVSPGVGQNQVGNRWLAVLSSAMEFLRALWRGRFSGYGLLALRVMLGAHLIHGTQDNVFSWSRMLEFRDFLAAEGFPLPLACAVVSVAAQFGCGALYFIGYLTRWAALVMLFNFTVALLVVHLDQPYAAAFPALMMWVGSLVLLLSGPGEGSLDERRGPRARTLTPRQARRSILGRAMMSRARDLRLRDEVEVDGAGGRTDVLVRSVSPR